MHSPNLMVEMTCRSLVISDILITDQRASYEHRICKG